MLILWILGMMASKSRKGKTWAMPTQLWNEPSDTPTALEANRSVEELGIQPYLGIK